MDVGAMLDVGQFGNGYPHPPPHRAFEIGPGLCLDHPLHQPRHNSFVHALYTLHIGLVGLADFLRGIDDQSGHVGLSVEGVETHGFWREIQGYDFWRRERECCAGIGSWRRV